jgi:YD repeat-containing protein
MKLISETYKELGITFSFPIRIKDANGERTYYENSDGDWAKWEYDANDKVTYVENSDGYWERWEYDAKGKQTYCEDSTGNKSGTPRSAKTCECKVVEVDGIKYKLTAL